MCIAVPGRVVRLDGMRATVDFDGNRVEANAGLVDVKVGDSVLVHAGCIIQVMSEEDREILMDLLAEIGELQDDD
jgi:hydrogenase expression/formation protein HypC